MRWLIGLELEIKFCLPIDIAFDYKHESQEAHSVVRSVAEEINDNVNSAFYFIFIIFQWFKGGDFNNF